MKKLLGIGMLAGAVLLAQGPPPRGPRGGFGGPGPESLGMRGEMGAGVTGAPFSGTQVTVHTQTLANGNSIQRQEQTTLSRDSQGRVRAETTRTGPNGQGSRTVVEIADPVAGVRRTLNAQNKTAFETTLPTRQNRGNHAGTGRPNPAGRRNGESANIVKEDLGTETINGAAASGTRVTHTIPANTIGNAQAIQIVRETWMSADLKVPVMVKTSDPRFGTTVTQLTNVNRAEPDASLFQTPADYTVTKGHGPAARGGRPPVQ
ncbi:MAG: hypothetical protein ACLPX8_04080 [Bryobacteraceae bacterium]|jgi:hypothetical protein